MPAIHKRSIFMAHTSAVLVRLGKRGDRISHEISLVGILTIVMFLFLPLVHAQEQAPPDADPARDRRARARPRARFPAAAQARKDVQIVGVFDPDAALQQKYAQQYGLPESVFFTDLGDDARRAKPQAVASFTSTLDHPAVVEAAAPRHMPVMMEKPLAVSMRRRAADPAGCRPRPHPGLRELRDDVVPESRARSGRCSRSAARPAISARWSRCDGHEGPKKINVQPEFFEWLTDPVKNGGGALFDFGCYGANLMTWLMDNQRPLAVTAVTQHFQPDVYPRVDDEATILVEYPSAQGIIQASWNWPFGRKDFEVYGEHGSAVATTGGGGLRVTLPNEPDHSVTPDERPADEHDSISHLIAVVRGGEAECAVLARQQRHRDRDPRIGARVVEDARARRGADADDSTASRLSALPPIRPPIHMR